MVLDPEYVCKLLAREPWHQGDAHLIISYSPSNPGRCHPLSVLSWSSRKMVPRSIPRQIMWCKAPGMSIRACRGTTNHKNLIMKWASPCSSGRLLRAMSPSAPLVLLAKAPITPPSQPRNICWISRERDSKTPQVVNISIPGPIRHIAA